MKSVFIFAVFLAFILALALPVHSDDLLSGRAVYMRNCAACHGEVGKGDGPMARTLQMQPANLTDPQLMTTIKPEDIERAVIRGVPRVKEHTFGHLLKQEDVRNLIIFVRSLVRR